jgi:type IV secretory pathway VirB10-like protein
VTPEVNNHVKEPDGSLPKKYILLVLFVMMLVILASVVFNAKQSAKPLKTAALPPMSTKEELDKAAADAKASEDRFRKLADTMAAKEQQQAERDEGGGIRETRREGQKEIDPIEQDRRKHEYQSAFAALAVSNAGKGLNYGRPVVEESRTRQQAETSPDQQKEDEQRALPEPNPDAEEKYKLFEGTIIEAALTNRIEGEFAGPVNCQITQDVQSADLQHVLIPRGTRVLGTAKQVQHRDQSRLGVEFHRMILPSGYSVKLDQTIGLDQAGAAALKDKVNRHYLSTFATSLMLGVIAGFSLSGSNGIYNGDGSDIYRQGVAQQLGQDATRILDRNLQRLPTITIREGTLVRIHVAADMELPEYKGRL